jgi:glycosyltransferase involved in cell wall biosynthesis
MRALVVTPLPPPVAGKDVQALYQRLGMFVGALGRAAEELEILHFVSEGHAALAGDMNDLDAAQAAYWGTPVRTTLAPTRAPRLPALQYAMGCLSLYAHPTFFPYSGIEQARILQSCLARNPDVVFVHRLAGMGPLVAQACKLPLVLFDLDDVEHWVKIRSALVARSWGVKMLNMLQVPAVFVAERRSIGRSSRTFVCSETDRRYLERLGRSGVVAIPNTVPIPSEPQPISTEQTILFLGGYYYRPNVEAAERLIATIWPRIRLQLPQARLLIAGKSPESIPSFHKHPIGVEFTGQVDDLAALYRRSRVICCPLSNGGGTRVKLIEAAAQGRPIVSTMIGAEGLSFKNETEILLRDDDASIAQTCIRLLDDISLCARLGAAAHRAARIFYDRRMIQDQIVAEVMSAVGKARPPHPAMTAQDSAALTLRP